MLLEFSFSNYRSFLSETTLSLEARRQKRADGTRYDDVTFTPDASGAVPLLKSAAIYGANASGKTNLVAAMEFMRSFVLNSSRESQADDPIPVEPYALREKQDGQASMFEVVLFVEGRRYRYGFRVDRERVHEEWLYYVPRKRETRLFHRTDQEVDLNTTFREGQGLIERTRKNALFLSVVAQFNGQLATRLMGWFREAGVLRANWEFSYRPYTVRQLEDAEQRKRIMTFLEELDLGFSEIQLMPIEDLPVEELKKVLAEEFIESMTKDPSNWPKLVNTVHERYDADGNVVGSTAFNLDSQESEGTKKVFGLSGPIVDTLQHGKVLFVDELDARLHPRLTEAIVHLFHSRRTNPKNAQLIMVTHDINLLGQKLFRRDQVWFVEKQRTGESLLYSLAEFKGVRADRPFERDYALGRYGAVPYVGAVEAAIDHDLDSGSRST